MAELNRQALVRIGIAGREHEAIDVGLVLRLLLLYETLYIESDGLDEVLLLATSIGYRDFLDLVQQKIIVIAPTPFRAAVLSGGNMGKDHFEFGIVEFPSAIKGISKNLASLAEMSGEKGQALRKQKDLIAGHLRSVPREKLYTLNEATSRDLAFNTELATAVLIRELQLRQKTEPEKALQFDIDLNSGGVSIKSNISEAFGFPTEDADSVISEAFAAALRLNERLCCMEHHRALAGIRSNDSAFLTLKLSFLLSSVSPEVVCDRFDQVVELSGFPDVDSELTDKTIALKNVLKIRETAEWKAFISWMRSEDFPTEKEFLEKFGDLREQFARISNSKVTKTVRWVASTAAGLAGDPGAFGTLDTFFLSKWLPKPGPISFISQNYKSLFNTPWVG